MRFRYFVYGSLHRGQGLGLGLGSGPDAESQGLEKATTTTPGGKAQVTVNKFVGVLNELQEQDPGTALPLPFPYPLLTQPLAPPYPPPLPTP